MPNVGGVRNPPPGIGRNRLGLMAHLTDRLMVIGSAAIWQALGAGAVWLPGYSHHRWNEGIMNYEGIVPLMIGLYATLLGFGVLSLGADPQRNHQWRERYGRMMKICGPLCMAFGASLLFRFIV